MFRRGPSRHVAVLKWRLDADVVELGQWFHGRIYERRCDLSPDGELMVYFAAKYRAPLATWTAVSRPPYLTALALWPNGSGWGGGGLFATANRLGLNHRAEKMLPAEPRTIPPGFTVARYAEYAGYGEDDPVCFDRMARDGWVGVAAGRASRYRAHGPERWTFEEPEIAERFQPSAPPRGKGSRPFSPVALRRELRGVGVSNGPWYREAFMLRHPDGTVGQLPACEWADWQSNGDLLFARGSCLYRVSAKSAARAAADPIADARLVANLDSLIFERIDTPAAALKWPARRSDVVTGRRIGGN